MRVYGAFLHIAGLGLGIYALLFDASLSGTYNLGLLVRQIVLGLIAVGCFVSGAILVAGGDLMEEASTLNGRQAELVDLATLALPPDQRPVPPPKKRWFRSR